jgi:hypothetical protein
MLYLLLHVTMFSKLENDCCLQLTGAPVGQAARMRARVAADVARAATSTLERVAGGRAVVTVESQLPSLQLPGGLGIAAEASPAGPAELDPVTEQHPHAAPVNAATTAGKRRRPSSWQRLKARRVHASHARADLPPTQPQEDAFPLLPPFPPQQQHQQSRASDLIVLRRQRQPGDPMCDHPRGLPKPGDMVIDRSAIFYCASFPPKPGFPANREPPPPPPPLLYFKFFS